MTPQVEILRVPSWKSFRWLKHGFSTRVGGATRANLEGAHDAKSWGELNLGFTPDDSEINVTRNRNRFLSQLAGGTGLKLLTVRQIHSNVTESMSLASLSGTLDADGMITQDKGIALGILTADCVPVLVADPQQRVVAAFHAGWRGSVARVVELGIEKVQAEFGSDPKCLVAAIGPCIRSCCYGVGEEVASRFRSEFSYADHLILDRKREREITLDLVEANRRQLLDAGVRSQAIDLIGECTYCRPDRYFSHRQSGGRTGRMMSLIGVQQD